MEMIKPTFTFIHKTNLKFYTFRKVDAVNEWYSRFYGGE